MAQKKVTQKKVVQKNTRKIQKQANGSTTIALPAELLRELKWKDKQVVLVKKRGEGILIEKWVKPVAKTTPKPVSKKTAAKKK